ncbi:MAG: PIG-L deacetylase family protein [Lachnospiraceae bacterium]
MKKKLLFTALFLALLVGKTAESVYADELTPTLSLSNGGNSAKLTDDSHYTTVKFDKEDTITITASNDSCIYGIYISWGSQPVAWTLTTDSGNLSCGLDGFLHEYVSLESPSSSVMIQIPADSMYIDGIRIFGEGELPPDVQVWNPSCERADIMVVSSHADDEILFFGGVLPTYAYLYDAEIQVVYMCEFWTTSKVREHEKLDGLWEAGIRFYPVCGNFYDIYSKDRETAKNQYDYNEMVSFLVAQIRDFQPQVIVTHDIFGEYGHGFHQLTCQSVMAAVELAAKADEYPESAKLYGTWNTPKTYLHIFPVNSITLDLRIPIEEDYAGRTAIEILKKAYTKHVSQQYCWFYVSDDYEYSCADFGLYRSLVGPDTTNDLLCNLKTYAVQEKEEAARLEAERIAALKAEEERLAAEEAAIAARKVEEERLAAEKAAAALKAEEERLAAEEAARLEAEQIAAREAERSACLAEIQRLSKELDAAEKRILLLACSTLFCLLAAAGAWIKTIIASHHKNTKTAPSSRRG